MVVSEKTGINLAVHNCDKFASLLMAYRGIEIQEFQQEIEQPFLRMAFSFLKSAGGKLLFVVKIGRSHRGKEVDRLIPANAQEAVAFSNLMAQMSVNQRENCRKNCNPSFDQCIITQTLKLYRKRLIAKD